MELGDFLAVHFPPFGKYDNPENPASVRKILLPLGMDDESQVRGLRGPASGEGHRILNVNAERIKMAVKIYLTTGKKPRSFPPSLLGHRATPSSNVAYPSLRTWETSKTNYAVSSIALGNKKIGNVKINDFRIVKMLKFTKSGSAKLWINYYHRSWN